MACGCGNNRGNRSNRSNGNYSNNGNYSYNRSGSNNNVLGANGGTDRRRTWNGYACYEVEMTYTGPWFYGDSDNNDYYAENREGLRERIMDDYDDDDCGCNNGCCCGCRCGCGCCCR